MRERACFLAWAFLAALSCNSDQADPAAAGGGPDPDPITDLSSGAECAGGSELGYASFGRDFVDKYCLSCHTETLMGAARMAPEGRDFDDVEGIRKWAHQIDSFAAAGPKGTHSTMPPSAPFPTMQERQKLGEWLACGVPD
ncbi:MAG TPA: hypothetical protein VJR89_16840 [Polyangiales bacterium]|nr:hypothetical protein [Polyangiales bacterium]